MSIKSVDPKSGEYSLLIIEMRINLKVGWKYWMTPMKSWAIKSKIKDRSVFTALSNTYDGAFLEKELTAFSR